MKFTILAALAIAASASVASAETRMSTSYSDMEIGGVETQGLTFEIDGYQSDFDYELSFTDGEVGGSQYQAFDAQVGWLGLDMGAVQAGPVLSYQSAEVNNAGWNDYTAAGVMMRAQIDAFTVTADLQSDVENFGDDYVAGLEGVYAVNAAVDVFGDYTYTDVADQHELELGARYVMANGLYVEAAGQFQDINGTSGKGARVGVGVRF